jgi:hypothetical protein
VLLPPLARAIIAGVKPIASAAGYVFTTNGRSAISGWSAIKKVLDAAMGEEAPDEFPVSRLDPVADERRSPIRAFDLLDVEANFGNAVLDIEVEQPIRLIERKIGEHRDHVERDPMVLQQAGGAHHLRVRPTATAAATGGVMNVCRPVDAQANPDFGSGKETCPVVVHQQPVGLEAVPQIQLGGATSRHERVRLIVPGKRNRQRFASVPRHIELPERALEHALASEVQCVEAHPRCRLTVGQIAIRAIDVAEWRRLQHKKPQPRRSGINAGARTCRGVGLACRDRI